MFAAGQKNINSIIHDSYRVAAIFKFHEGIVVHENSCRKFGPMLVLTYYSQPFPLFASKAWVSAVLRRLLAYGKQGRVVPVIRAKL
jgi:hypothetical protein